MTFEFGRRHRAGLPLFGRNVERDFVVVSAICRNSTLALAAAATVDVVAVAVVVVVTAVYVV